METLYPMTAQRVLRYGLVLSGDLPTRLAGAGFKLGHILRLDVPGPFLARCIRCGRMIRTDQEARTDCAGG